MQAVHEEGGGGVFICPLLFDLGMEFDGKVGEHCTCSFIPHYMGRRLLGISFCKEQDGPDGEEQ